MSSKTTTLYNIGISYKKADAQTRSIFSISKTNQSLLLEEANAKGIDGIFIVSTCNRTEVTGFAEHPYQLIELLCKYSKGTVEAFVPVSTILKDQQAIDHLFRICAGLESQILGDYEIIGQMKTAFKLAKTHQTTNTYTERLMNALLQASKSIKNNTKLSAGTTSIAYAAVQYLTNNVPNFEKEKITLFGFGDVGKNTCKNLLEYTQSQHIHLVNRTHETIACFGKDYNNIQTSSLETLTQEIKTSTVLIVTTAADYYTITEKNLALQPGKELLILDMSMPENVDPEIAKLPGVTLVNIDTLSKITDQTIEIRKKEVPLAEAIINEHKEEFQEWAHHRKFTPILNNLKTTLLEIQNEEIDFHQKKIKNFNPEHAEIITSRFIQKITTQFAKHLKHKDTSTNHSIEIISKVFDFKFSENKIEDKSLIKSEVL